LLRFEFRLRSPRRHVSLLLFLQVVVALCLDPDRREV